MDSNKGVYFKHFESLNQIPTKIQNLDALDLAVSFGANQITKHIISTQDVSDNKLGDFQLSDSSFRVGINIC